MTEQQKKLAIKILKRVLWEGTKAVVQAGAIVAITAFFKGELKDISFEELVDGDIKGGLLK